MIGWLSPQDQEERLSVVYVRAVAAMAGYTTSEDDLDRKGVDLTINGRGIPRRDEEVIPPAPPPRPAEATIDVQLKATKNLRNKNEDEFSYPLKRKNYDQLRDEDLPTPRILIVLNLPKERSEWLEITAEHLKLRKCAYWVSLWGFEESDNKETITVTIKKDHIFDVAALRRLMQQVITHGKIIE